MSFWQQLLGLVFVPTAVVAVVAYLLRKSLEHGLSRDLERFKAELDRRTQEYLLRFSLLHERRADAIAQLHVRLVKLRRRLDDLTGIQWAGTQPIEEKASLAAVAGNDAREFFEAHRIYFEEGLAEQAEEVLGLMRKAFVSFDTGASGEQRQGSSDAYDALKASAGKLVRHDIPPLMAALEHSFRKQLSGSPVPPAD